VTEPVGAGSAALGTPSRASRGGSGSGSGWCRHRQRHFSGRARETQHSSDGERRMRQRALRATEGFRTVSSLGAIGMPPTQTTEIRRRFRTVTYAVGRPRSPPTKRLILSSARPAPDISNDQNAPSSRARSCIASALPRFWPLLLSSPPARLLRPAGLRSVLTCRLASQAAVTHRDFIMVNECPFNVWVGALGTATANPGVVPQLWGDEVRARRAAGRLRRYIPTRAHAGRRPSRAWAAPDAGDPQGHVGVCAHLGPHRLPVEPHVRALASSASSRASCSHASCTQQGAQVLHRRLRRPAQLPERHQRHLGVQPRHAGRVHAGRLPHLPRTVRSVAAASASEGAGTVLTMWPLQVHIRPDGCLRPVQR
jgi:hypothetical protein